MQRVDVWKTQVGTCISQGSSHSCWTRRVLQWSWRIVKWWVWSLRCFVVGTETASNRSLRMQKGMLLGYLYLRRICCVWKSQPTSTFLVYRGWRGRLKTSRMTWHEWSQGQRTKKIALIKCSTLSRPTSNTLQRVLKIVVEWKHRTNHRSSSLLCHKQGEKMKMGILQCFPMCFMFVWTFYVLWIFVWFLLISLETCFLDDQHV